MWNDIWFVSEVVVFDVMLEMCVIIGNIVFSGFIVFKFMWVVKYEFEVFVKVVKVLLLKDYLWFWLIGDIVVDLLDVVGISWFDIGKCDWLGDVLNCSGFSVDYMLFLVEGFEVLGMLCEMFVVSWSIKVFVVVVGGVVDNVVVVCGVGCFVEG